MFGAVLLVARFAVTLAHRVDCLYDGQCPQHASCYRFSETEGVCECDGGYITREPYPPCDYHQKSQLTTFLISFFVGWLGVDWFYLAVGNPWYIVAGVVKLITAGGFGIWWIVDFIRVIVNAFPDGNDLPLYDNR
ncbi:hypothetical protein JKP88DRAFT_166410 [Tribonema minus]|uniref:TM2 domain-containing protein n=1 Tax=Tribonema minus TaxID=303371 RepID=A0A835YS76_9STRA|nr:hypothetical protein JKP88DRAFT_166410 [Tribonema minus]